MALRRPILRDRIYEVIKTDSITEDRLDFLITHVPMNGIIHLNRYSDLIASGTCVTEEEAFSSQILNPEDRHQFIMVYGQSGTGKSHLIRWFYEKMLLNKPENEVVLLIKRSDNSLKGSIRQLLQLPEVQNLPDHDRYQRLTKVSNLEDKAMIRDRIYYNLILQTGHYKETNTDDSILNRREREELSLLLHNDRVKDHLLDPQGPIERIYVKVAGGLNTDPDLKASFKSEDFYWPDDDLDESVEEDGRKVYRIKKKLISEDGERKREKFAQFLNQFTEKIIKDSVDIHEGDFRDIFQEIRCELKRQNKNLTLLIEDITSFSGVNEELVDVLLTDHNSDPELCRISSIIGSTEGYLQSDFRSNTRDRVTSYLYLPDNLFKEEFKYEFFARYLNALCLQKSQIQQWVDGNMNPEDYPIAHFEGEQFWDQAQISGTRHSISLSPFTKRSIDFDYGKLEVNKRTPRYMIKDILEQGLQQILDSPASFPGPKYTPSGSYISSDIEQAISQFPSADLQNRMNRFLSVWGNGKAESINTEFGKFAAGLHESIFDEFQLPFPQFRLIGFNQGTDQIPALTSEKDSEEVKAETQPAVVPAVPFKGFTQTLPSSNLITPSINPTIPSEHTDLIETIPKIVVVEKQTVQEDPELSKAKENLRAWKDGRFKIDRTTRKENRIFTDAVSSLEKMLYESINWQSEGVSYADLSTMAIRPGTLLMFEGQKNISEQDVVLILKKEDFNTIWVTEAMIRWKVYGKGTWNYPEGMEDAMRVTQWIRKNQNKYISLVKPDKDIPVYVKDAVKFKILYDCLLGAMGTKKAENYEYDALFKPAICPKEWLKRHDENWKKTIEKFQQKEKAILKILKDAFVYTQGNQSSSQLIINTTFVQSVLKQITKEGLLAFDPEAPFDSISKRAEVSRIYQELARAMSNLIVVENQERQQLGLFFKENLESHPADEEEIRKLINAIKDFKQHIAEANIRIILKDQTDLSNLEKDFAHKAARGISELNVPEDEDSYGKLNALKSSGLYFARKLYQIVAPIIDREDQISMMISERKQQVEQDLEKPDWEARSKRINEIQQVLSEVKTYGAS